MKKIYVLLFLWLLSGLAMSQSMEQREIGNSGLQIIPDEIDSDIIRRLIGRERQRLPPPFDLNWTEPDCPKTIKTTTLRVLSENRSTYITDPITGRRYYQTTNRNDDMTHVVLGRASLAMNENEKQSCDTEIGDRAINRIEEGVFGILTAYIEFPAALDKYETAALEANVTQCDPDMIVVHKLRDSLDLITSRMNAFRTMFGDYNLIAKHGREKEVEREYSKGGSELNISFEISSDNSANKVGIRINVTNIPKPQKVEVSWEEKTYSITDLASITYQRPIYTVTEPTLRAIDLKTTEINESWKHQEDFNKDGKEFRVRIPAPVGYEYCNHTMTMKSHRAVCDNDTDVGNSGVAVMARIVGGDMPWDRWRGSYVFDLELTSISKDATFCQRQKAGCILPSSYEKIPSNPGHCMSWSGNTESGRSNNNRHLCHTTCVPRTSEYIGGQLFCHYGVDVAPGRCRPEVIQRCGTCSTFDIQ